MMRTDYRDGCLALLQSTARSDYGLWTAWLFVGDLISWTRELDRRFVDMIYRWYDMSLILYQLIRDFQTFAYLHSNPVHNDRPGQNDVINPQ